MVTATKIASSSSSRASDFQKGARALMRTGGRRMTRQRSLLLEVMEGAEGHLDADELYRLARQHDPRLSLSTVYRTLLVLKDHGLIEELHLSEEHHHYEIKGTSEHYHVVCRRCGAVEEFTSELTAQLRADLLKRTGFHVETMDIDISGLCARCRAAA
ncbi:MAG: transcriptional repressor [Dehalococcoidia bacterium]|nr:transcriptional repressor [Dehalococcoidia bacterium]